MDPSIPAPAIPQASQLTPGSLGAAVLGIGEALPQSFLPEPDSEGGLSYWLGAIAGFVATLVVGLIAAVLIGAVLLLVGMISAKLAIIIGAVLLIAAIGYLIYTRVQQMHAHGAPWYAYALSPLLAIGDLLGITGIIEGITGRDIITGAVLDQYEAGQRLGSGLAGVLISLVTAGTARAGGIGAKGFLPRINVGQWLSRVRIGQGV